MATAKEDKIVRGSDLAVVGAQVKAKLAEKLSSENLDNILYLSSAEYDALASKDPNTIYVVTDGGEELYPHDGVDGKSAYQIWLDNGNTGTESDFLESLKGDTGVQIDEETFMGTIVNDKTTGGADKAWSAQMGKQISADVNNLAIASVPVISSLTKTESVDVSSIGVRSYYIDGSTGKYTTNSSYKHSIYPVSSGQVVRVTANSTNSAIVSFLKSDASPTSGGTPDYCNEYLSIYRVVIDSGEYMDFVVPSDAGYIYFYRGASSSYPYTPESIIIRKPSFDKNVVLEEAYSTDIASVGVVAEAVFDSSRYSEQVIELDNIVEEDLAINSSANFASGSHYNIPVSKGDVVHIVGGSVDGLAAMLPCVYGPNSGSSTGASKVLPVIAGKEQWFKVPDGTVAFLFNVTSGETDVCPETVSVYRSKDEGGGQSVPVFPAHRFKIESGKLIYVAYTSYRGFIFPVKKRHIYNIYPTTNGNPMQRGFISELPKIGLDTSDRASYSSAAIEGMSWSYTATEDGYFFVNTYKSSSPSLSLQVYDVSENVSEKIDIVSENGRALRSEELVEAEDLVKNVRFEQVNFETVAKRSYYIQDENGAYNTYTTYKHCLIPVTEGQYVRIIANASYASSLAWFTSNDASASGAIPPYLDQTRIWFVSAGVERYYRVPAGAKYLYVYAGQSGYAYLPQYLGVSVNVEKQPEIVRRNDYSKTRQILEQFKSRTRYELDSSTANVPLVLLHYSDIHGMKGCQNRINEYRSFWSKYIDDTIQTGDLMADRFTDEYPWGDSSDPDNPNRDILCVIGNHDTATGTGTSRNWHDKQGLESYNKFIAPYIDNWNVVQPASAAENGYCFYYKDYNDSHVRLVVIDAWNTNTDYNAVQLSWFTDVLDSARSSGLSVIIASHFRIKAESILKTPFSKPNTDVSNPDSSVYNDPYIPIVTSFINNGGSLICWITGHSHYDAISRTSEATGHQINICIANASRQGSDNTLKITNNLVSVVDENPKTFDLFNLICVDTVFHIVALLRVGSNYDKFGRRIETTCIDYSTGEVVYP